MLSCVSLVCLNTLVASFNGGHRDKTLLHSTPVYSTLLGSDWQRCDSIEERVDAGFHKAPKESTQSCQLLLGTFLDLLNGTPQHLKSMSKDPLCTLKSYYCKYDYYCTKNTIFY